MAGQVKKLNLSAKGTVEVEIEEGDLDLSELPMQLAVRIGGIQLTISPVGEVGAGTGIYCCVIQPKWKALAQSICVPGAAVERDQ